MKMSKLMEHNHHHQTDELYEPLRKALTKSTMPYHLSPAREVTPDKVSHSKITHNLRLLSALEADKIVKSVLFSAKPHSFQQIRSSFPQNISKEYWESTSMQLMFSKEKADR